MSKVFMLFIDSVPSIGFSLIVSSFNLEIIFLCFSSSFLFDFLSDSSFSFLEISFWLFEESSSKLEDSEKLFSLLMIETFPIS